MEMAMGKACNAEAVTEVGAPEVEGSWVRVLAGDGPAAGTVCPARLVVGDGSDPEYLAVWRTESGELCVVADRCPHQWSSLVEEGFVDGEFLVCAAHGWRFDADGSGSKLAMNGRADVKAPVPVYASRSSVDGVWVRLPGGRGT